LEFVHLHVHSQYSLQDGFVPVKDLVNRAADLGMRALALTDEHTLAGIPLFWTECHKRNIKPIVGAELNVWYDDAKNRDDDHNRLIFLVESEKGYLNLVYLVTLANNKKDGAFCGVCYSDLFGHTEGLVVLVGARKSWLRYLLSRNMRTEAEEYLNFLVLDDKTSLFDNDQIVFALEPEGGDLDTGIISRLFRAANVGSFLCVAVANVRCLAIEDSICCDFVDNVTPPESFDPKQIRRRRSNQYMMTQREMMSRLDNEMHIAIANTLSIVDRCSRLTLDFESLRSPEQDFIRGMNAETYLCDKTLKCALSRLNVKQLSEEVKERLDLEFDYIMGHNWVNNMLLLHEIAHYCRDNSFMMGVGHNHMLTCLVAYILGITQINPLDYHLRFLGFEEGQEVPTEKRSLYCLSVEVPKQFSPYLSMFLSNHLGADHAVVMGRFKNEQEHVILRRIVRWVGIDKTDENEFILDILQNDKANIDVNMSAKTYFEQKPISTKSKEFISFVLSRTLGIIKGLEPEDGQFAVSADNIRGLVPVVDVQGISISQYDRHALDSFGIPRLLIDSNNMLDILDTAVRCIRDQEHPKFNPEEVSMDDDDTFSMISRADTFGVDLLESLTIRSLLRENSPHSFVDLLRLLSSDEATKAGIMGDICQRLPDCLLAYRLMYVKAHYPRAFFAALLSQSLKNKHHFYLALRELESKSLKLIPPNIHQSGFHFDVKPAGIQVGLMAVSGLSNSIFEVIDHARKSGEFIGIVDFCNRLLHDSGMEISRENLIDRELVESLIESGAMDVFNYKRPQLIWILEQWCNGLWRDSVSECSTTSGIHFRRKGYTEISIPEQEDWTLSEKSQRESKVLGWSPCLNLFWKWNPVLRTLHCVSVSSVNTGRIGHVLCFAGLVASSMVEGHPLSQKYPVVLDFEGRAFVCEKETAMRILNPVYESAPVIAVATVMRDTRELYIRNELVWPVVVASKMLDIAKEIALDLDNFGPLDLLKLNFILRSCRGGKTKVMIREYPKSWMSRVICWWMSHVHISVTPTLVVRLKAFVPEGKLHFILSEEFTKEFVPDLGFPCEIAEAVLPKEDSEDMVDDEEKNSSGSTE